MSFIPEAIRQRITITFSDAPGLIGLGPMGNPGPTDFINLKTHRIPFKQSSMDLDQWRCTSPTASTSYTRRQKMKL
uniref:Uncharacterized protein n=1 Tax=Setaria viridis TaxID=4556 RepID=A0A4U6U646_SETVI|nr:hypothetical protein SEVIR_6G075800v2 [Setaria viridis]